MSPSVLQPRPLGSRDDFRLLRVVVILEHRRRLEVHRSGFACRKLVTFLVENVQHSGDCLTDRAGMGKPLF